MEAIDTFEHINEIKHECEETRNGKFSIDVSDKDGQMDVKDTFEPILNEIKNESDETRNGNLCQSFSIKKEVCEEEQEGQMEVIDIFEHIEKIENETDENRDDTLSGIGSIKTDICENEDQMKAVDPLQQIKSEIKTEPLENRDQDSQSSSRNVFIQRDNCEKEKESLAESMDIHIYEIKSDPDENREEKSSSNVTIQIEVCESEQGQVLETINVRQLQNHYDIIKNESLPEVLPIEKEYFTPENSVMETVEKFEPMNNCDVCKKKFFQRAEYNKHLYSVHGLTNLTLGILKQSEKLRCKNCQMRFTRKMYLEQHDCDHFNKKPTHKCCICKEEFNEKHQLTIHFDRDHLNTKAWKCPTCPAKFLTNELMKQHKCHKKKKPINHCDVCKKDFFSRTVFDEHLYSVHGLEASCEDMIKPSERLRCKNCQMGFMKKIFLVQHDCDHFKKPTHKCNICKMLFNNRNQLTIHFERFHLSRKVLECPKCPVKFLTKKLMKKHKCKKEEINQNCPICKKSVKIKQLSTHIDFVHLKKRYECQFCDKWYSHENSLRHHKCRGKTHKEVD